MRASITNELKAHRQPALLALLLSVAGIYAGFQLYPQSPEYAWLLFFSPAIFLTLAFLFVKAFDTLFWIAVFFTPFSMQILDEAANMGLTLPNEPLILLVMLAVLLKALFSGSLNKALLIHPITIGIYVYLGWLLVSSCFSTMPMVSIKFLLSRIWFIVVFYFFGINLFREKKNITRFIWVYSLPLAITVINTMINHRVDGFSRDASFYAQAPFFIDHGIYAATVAFMVPFIVVLVLAGQRLGLSAKARFFALGLLSLFITGILFSYTRAAWLSLAAAAALTVIFMLRIRLYAMFITLGIVGLLYLNFKEDIAIKLSRNKQASETGIDRQLQSITNISTDNSNLERINRWNSALAMWNEKPVFGFGPGTYIFKYGAYQHSSDLTPISTNFGDGGNSHSEYLNPLAETGVPGLLSVVLLILLFLTTAMKLIYHAPMKHVRWLAWGAILGLITYYAHGILNNYSDSDKTMVLIWAFAGMLVSLDVYGKNKVTSN